MSTFEETLALLGSAMGQMEALVALQTSSPISSIYRERDPMRRESMKESAETVIEQVDSQCSMLKALSERLSSMYGKLHHKRKMLQNSLVPVSSLPEELMEGIFRMAIDSNSSKKFDTKVDARPRYDTIDAIQLSHVCVTWRAVVQDNPLLKSFAVIPQSQIGRLKQTVKLLGQASKKPVTVHIIPPPVPRHSQTSIPELQNLSISLSRDQAATYINHLWNTTGQPPQTIYSQFPNLLSLNMDVPCLSENSEGFETLKWYLPTLKEAYLRGCLLSFEPRYLPSLQRLELKRVTIHPNDLTTLRDLCAQLERLEMYEITPSTLEPDFQVPQTTILCPRLSRIRFQHSSLTIPWFRQLLGSIETPCLTFFSLGEEFKCCLVGSGTILSVERRIPTMDLPIESINAVFMPAFMMIQNAAQTIKLVVYEGPCALFGHLGPYLFGTFPALVEVSIEFNDTSLPASPLEESNEDNQYLWTYSTFPNILLQHRNQFRILTVPPDLLPAEGLVPAV